MTTWPPGDAAVPAPCGSGEPSTVTVTSSDPRAVPATMKTRAASKRRRTWLADTASTYSPWSDQTPLRRRRLGAVGGPAPPYVTGSPAGPKPSWLSRTPRALPAYTSGAFVDGPALEGAAPPAAADPTRAATAASVS